MKKSWFKIFMGMFVLLFAGLWIASGVAEARSKRREHYRRNYPGASYNVGGIVSELAGGAHTIAFKTDSTVWAWGWNRFGQLGAETTETCYSELCSTTPVQVSGLTDVAAIVAGDSHSIALKTDGTVWAWGANYYGQLGTTEVNYYTPMQVSGLTDVNAIAAGGNHTVAIKTDGTVWSWGSNEGGQLGDATTTNRYTPVQVLVTP